MKPMYVQARFSIVSNGFQYQAIEAYAHLHHHILHCSSPRTSQNASSSDNNTCNLPCHINGNFSALAAVTAASNSFSIPWGKGIDDGSGCSSLALTLQQQVAISIAKVGHGMTT
jgi:hypothetical protein